MGTTMADTGHVDQRENAFQKQPTIFVGKRRAGVSKKKGRHAIRWYKNVGLGFKTPREAIEGNYIDKKCSWVGDVSIRGRIMRGMVISTKMNRTIVVRRDYLHYIPKYNRFEKRHKNVSAHLSPALTGVTNGDIVTLGQCRPLSKTVRFNVLKVEKQEIEGIQK